MINERFHNDPVYDLLEGIQIETRAELTEAWMKDPRPENVRWEELRKNPVRKPEWSDAQWHAVQEVVRIGSSTMVKLFVGDVCCCVSREIQHKLQSLLHR